MRIPLQTSFASFFLALVLACAAPPILARHAAANNGDVEVVGDAAEVRLVVTDDGVGISAGQAESGLRNARRRAEALGGRLELSRREPHGTSFVWRVPLTRG